VKKTVIAVALVVAGACGRPTTVSAPSPTTPTTHATTSTTAPARNAPAVTTPDLSDVDKAMASIDADIAKADRDITNEGAPER
jgi:hypothetical protein